MGLEDISFKKMGSFCMEGIFAQRWEDETTENQMIKEMNGVCKMVLTSESLGGTS